MSSQGWLRAYTGADLGNTLYSNNSSKWQERPAISCYRFDMCCLNRTSSLQYAVKYNQDWTFEQQDRGAFSLTIDGTESSKHGLVISLGSDMSDAFGFFLVLGRNGAQVWRHVVGEKVPDNTNSSNDYMQQNFTHAPGTIQSVSRPLQQSGAVSFTVTYEYGVLKIYEGLDANQPGALLLSYENKTPGFGNYMWGIGLWGKPNGDKLSVKRIKKWEAVQPSSAFFNSQLAPGAKFTHGNFI